MSNDDMEIKEAVNAIDFIIRTIIEHPNDWEEVLKQIPLQKENKFVE